MRNVKLILVLSILIIIQVSCIERKTKKTSEANMIEAIEGPRVIRDTIIQTIVVVDTVDSRYVAPVEQPKPVARTSSSSSRYEDGNDRVDRGNSGFFDSYKSNYGGDPNRDLKPTTRVVVTDDGGNDIERKKEALEKSLDVLEQRNQQEQQRYQQAEQERQAANQRALQEARNQQQQQKAQPKGGKTLDTNLLLNNKK